MAFLELWRIHPRDFDRLTVGEVDTLAVIVDQRVADAETPEGDD